MSQPCMLHTDAGAHFFIDNIFVIAQYHRVIHAVSFYFLKNVTFFPAQNAYWSSFTHLFVLYGFMHLTLTAIWSVIWSVISFGRSYLLTLRSAIHVVSNHFCGSLQSCSNNLSLTSAHYYLFFKNNCIIKPVIVQHGQITYVGGPPVLCDRISKSGDDSLGQVQQRAGVRRVTFNPFCAKDSNYWQYNFYPRNCTYLAKTLHRHGIYIIFFQCSTEICAQVGFIMLLQFYIQYSFSGNF